MDLKHKSAKWAGSIYHTFEAMCHEVDDFVSQETVKYVENQAHAVGGSVKRFYSNVVQDFLPSSLALPGKHEDQVLFLEQSEKDVTYNKAVGIEDMQKHTDVSDNGNLHKSDIVLVENDQKREQTGKMWDFFFDENEPTGMLKEEWMTNNVKANDLAIDLSRPQEKKERMKVKAVNVKESDLKKEPSRPKEKEQWINIKAYKVDKNDLKKEHSLSRKKEVWISINANSIEENDPKRKLFQPNEMDLFCPENEDLPEASLSINIPKIEVSCNSDLSNSIPPTKMICVASVENKTEESGIVYSGSPLSSDIVPNNEENICFVNKIGCPSDPSNALSSSHPLPTVSRDDRDANPALSSSAFNEDIPSADDIAALVGSFEDNHSNDYAHLEALMSFLKVDEEDDCMIDTTDPSMVTIDLSDNMVKVDESCLLMENKLLYAVVSRARNHKSFKKILQDAFASRKRLRKEYEQLGILFGDIDIELRNQPGDNLLPEIPSSSSGLGKLSSDALREWELL